MKRDRLREVALPLTLVFAGSAVVGLLLLVLLTLTGVDIGLTLSIVGLVIALLLPLGIELRNRTTRPRRVTFIDYRKHHFGQGVAAGLVEVLKNDKRHWRIDIVLPDSTSGLDTVQWQTHELQTALIKSADAVVVIPAGDEPGLWHSMAALVKSGAAVVAVDTKPPNSVFRKLALEGPKFVSSRYDETGLLIGDWLVEWLSDDDERLCILWIGPKDSWPGKERSRNVLYQITSAGLGHRVTPMSIPDWSPDRERCVQTHKLMFGMPGEVAVYCADDENAIALHVLTLNEYTHARSRMKIIGCNATPDDWGNVPAFTMKAVDVTVDVQAREQGKEAATLLIKQRSGSLYSDERSAYISPLLKVPEYAVTLEESNDELGGSAESGPLVTPLREIDRGPAEIVDDNPIDVPAIRSRIEI
ncbi:MAG TPA: hypothetical protein VGN49_12150 [Micrococcaceae bacterium]|jgi:ABC-type sugar transport system substrate-binding protein|nr:hypothetical protein [Micrococcaceae bacterium]